jgi:16S rRNA (cytosine967-C5)-methyltransferase
MEALESATRFVKNGGQIVYVTCSVLKAENEDRISAFLETHGDYLPLEAGNMARAAGLPALAAYSSTLGAGLRLSPLRTATDGFYVAALTRAG